VLRAVATVLGADVEQRSVLVLVDGLGVGHPENYEP
jgi:deoxyinosine 3'endonuclease (endonuclease V)